MGAPPFDLIDIIRVVEKKFRFILLVTGLAAVAGLVVFLVRPKKYKAETRFLVNNPLYGDRITLFRSMESRWVDFWGGDDDLDKVTSLATSDTVIDRVIRNSQFQQVYKMDINDPKGHAGLMGIYKKNFNLKRSEYKDISISYVAYDPVVSANVANMSVKVLEETYRHYYTAIKEGMRIAISDKLTQIDSTIEKLTDSLAGIRDEYHIYSILSPNRQNLMSSEITGDRKGLGKAIEEIQNVESIKDQLVTDRAHYISNLNEFAATENSSMDFLKVITRAVPPTGPTGPTLMMTVLVAGMCGLFFSLLFVLLMDYYRLIKRIER